MPGGVLSNNYSVTGLSPTRLRYGLSEYQGGVHYPGVIRQPYFVKGCDDIIGAAEETEYFNRFLADVAQVVGDHGRYQGEFTLGDPSLLLAHAHFYRTLENKQHLLGAIRVPAQVIARLQFKVNHS